MFNSPFPDYIGFQSVRVDPSNTDLIKVELTGEELAIADELTSLKRKKEFIAGRIAGHRAAAQLSHHYATISIGKAKGEEPSWPEELTGSISHSFGWAVAGCAFRTRVVALGLDIENLQRPINLRLSERICSAKEIAWLSNSGKELNEQLITVFSAKEAIFKALYPLCRLYFGYKDVELFGNGNLGFVAELRRELCNTLPIGFAFPVHTQTVQRFTLASVLIER